MTPDKLNSDKAFVMDEYEVGALSSLEVSYFFQPDQILAYTDSPLDVGIDIAVGGGQGAGLIPLRGQGPASFPGLSPNQRLTLYNLDSVARTLLLIAQRGYLPITVTAPVETIGGGVAVIWARARRTTNQSIPTATLTPIIFDQEVADTDNIFAVGNPTRMSIVTPGLYFLRGSALMVGGAVQYEYGIRKNGTTELARVGEVNAPATSLAWSAMCIDNAAAGDYYEFYVYQASGGAKNVTAVAGILPLFECGLIMAA
jgi:hypothetical protein